MPSAAEIVKAHRFVLLAKSWCPDVRYASNVFKKYSVYDKLHVIELDKMNPTEALKLEGEFTKLSGRKWVPSIFVGGQYWGNEGDLSKLESLDQTEKAFKDIGLL